MQAKCILFTGVHQVSVDVAEIPAPSGNEVLLETAYTAISPGTEGRSLNGQQAGASSWPFIPGYSLVGKVIAKGPDAHIAEGSYVFTNGTTKSDRNRTWGGHVSHAVVPETSVIPLAPEADLVSAALTKLTAIAWHGARIANGKPGDNVAVVGLGPIGQLSARCFKARGANVVAGDISEARVQLAKAAGIEAVVVDSTMAGLRERLPQEFDLVVDSTGNPAVFSSIIPLVRALPWDNEPTPGGRILIQGSYPDGFSVPYDDCFRKEISIVFTRDNQRRDLIESAAQINDGWIPVRDLVGEVLEPEQAPQAYERLRNDPSVGTFVFRWNGVS